MTQNYLRIPHSRFRICAIIFVLCIAGNVNDDQLTVIAHTLHVDVKQDAQLSQRDRAAG